MKREGHGLLTGVDYVYQGDWEQDKRHGQGKETRGNQIFEGIFYMNQKRKGIMKYANGYIYDGPYLAGRKDGYGKLQMVGNKEIEYVEGFWTNNNIKVGTIKMKNGYYYNGQIKSNSIKHGKGVLCDSQRSIFQVAEYKDDQLVHEAKHSDQWINCIKSKQISLQDYNQMIGFFS